MEQDIFQQEQNHLMQISGKLQDHIELLQKRLRMQKGELLGERKEISDNFSDISDERAIDFSQVLSSLQLKERYYLNVSEVLEKLQLLFKSPYFGRIDIINEDRQHETLYIGLSTFCEEVTGDIVIYDWRSPIASLFYENKVGKASFQIPDGAHLEVEIERRRQFKIEYDRLLQLLDADLYIGDEVLQNLLTDTAKQKMKSIVATIQSDQNAVIRSPMNCNMMVLGPPGSGKTSVAMQRMAFLLYQYRKSMTAKNILLISPSDLFNDYISNVLPELGEENVVHSTYYRLFKAMNLKGLDVETYYENIERLQLAEDFDRDSYAFKGSSKYADQLVRYLEKLETSGMCFFNVKMADRVFASAKELTQLFYEKYGDLDMDFRLKKMRNFLEQRLTVWKDKAIDAGYKELQAINHYIGTDEELKQLNMRKVTKRFKSLTTTIKTLGYVNVNKLYLESIVFENCIDETKKVQQATGQNLKEGHIFYEDLAPLMYLHAYVKGIYRNLDIKHIVIDEMQDYSHLQLLVIKALHPKAYYTLLGDKNQLVHPTKKDSITGPISQEFTMIELNKSYRSTNEITNFMSAILNNHDTLSLGVSGDKPVIKRINQQYFANTIQTLLDAHYEENDSFVILCKDMASCRKLFEELKAVIPNLQLVTQDQKLYTKGILLMPGYMAKGFEFTTVVIADADQENYSTQMDSYFLYTLASRATRKLFILYSDTLAPALQLIDRTLYTIEDVQ